MRSCRYAVVGGGGIGSAAAYWLSRRAGEDVVCLEQWALGHRLGASEDHSRIIRLGYHSTSYTALTPSAYGAWRVVEEESGVQLVHTTGMVNIARARHGGRARSSTPTPRRWTPTASTPSASAPRSSCGAGRSSGSRRTTRRLFQADGGILDIRKAGAAHIALARARGATVLGDAGVRAIRPGPDGIELHTAAGIVLAEKVVLCAGAWTPGLLAGARRRLAHPPHPGAGDLLRDAAPAPLRARTASRSGSGTASDEEYYGFPVYGEVATKAAQDVGGPEAVPEPGSWIPDRERIDRVARFVETILPGYGGPELYTRCCLYDMPPDRHFVLDRSRDTPTSPCASAPGTRRSSRACSGGSSPS